MSDSQTPPELPKRVNPKPVVSQRPPSERIPGAQMAEPTRMHQSPPTQSAKRPPAPPPPEPNSGLVVPWWGFVLVILAVAGITCGLWGLALMNRGDSLVDTGPSPTPHIIVVIPTPTLGLPPGQITPTVPVIVPTQPGTAPTDVVVEPQPTSPSGLAPITVGCIVEVFGTEGFGVAVRQGPGRTYSFFFVAQDGQVFQVMEGPEEADTYQWWKVVDPEDSNNEGWVAQDYIQPIDQCP